MKKNIFVALLLAFLLTGCTGQSIENNVEQGELQSELSQTDQVPTDSVESSEEAEENININQEENKMENLQEINKVLMKTNMGDIKIELDWANAPISTENFLKYVQEAYYDGTIFHRVIKGFMVQGGGFDPEGEEKTPDEAIKNEAKNGLKNDRGTIAMARTMVVDSATSQFFINLVDNDFLNYRDEANYGYAVFGEVVEGMEVIDKMAEVKTGNNGPHGDWPIEDIVIESVSFIQ